MGLRLALKAFWHALRDRTFAAQLDRLLQGQAVTLSTTSSPLADQLHRSPPSSRHQALRRGPAAARRGRGGRGSLWRGVGAGELLGRAGGRVAGGRGDAFHCVFLEGVYLDRTEASLKPRFVQGEPPSDMDIAAVVQKISRRIIREAFAWSSA